MQRSPPNREFLLLREEAGKWFPFIIPFLNILLANNRLTGGPRENWKKEPAEYLHFARLNWVKIFSPRWKIKGLLINSVSPTLCIFAWTRVRVLCLCVGWRDKGEEPIRPLSSSLMHDIFQNHRYRDSR